MAEVLSSLGGLFGSGGTGLMSAAGANEALQKMQQGFGMIPQGGAANTALNTPLVLAPEQYSKMEALKEKASRTNPASSLMSDSTWGLLQSLQQPDTNKLEMMKLSGAMQPVQIPQQDLMNILKNLGGGF